MVVATNTIGPRYQKGHAQEIKLGLILCKVVFICQLGPRSTSQAQCARGSRLMRAHDDACARLTQVAVTVGSLEDYRQKERILCTEFK